MQVRAGEPGVARAPLGGCGPSAPARGYGSSAAPLALRHPSSLSPVQFNGWTAFVWSAAVAGHPLVALATAIGSSLALARRLPDLPPQAAVGLALRGHLSAGRQLATAVRRAWWPVVIVGAFVSRRMRWIAAVSVLADVSATPTDVAYGWGVWRGMWRHRTWAPVVPRPAHGRGSLGRRDRFGLHHRGRRRGPGLLSGRFLACFDQRLAEAFADVVTVRAPPDRAVRNAPETDGERCLQGCRHGEQPDQHERGGMSVEQPGDRRGRGEREPDRLCEALGPSRHLADRKSGFLLRIHPSAWGVTMRVTNWPTGDSVGPVATRARKPYVSGTSIHASRVTRNTTASATTNAATRRADVSFTGSGNRKSSRTGSCYR